MSGICISVKLSNEVPTPNSEPALNFVVDDIYIDFQLRILCRSASVLATAKFGLLKTNSKNLDRNYPELDEITEDVQLAGSAHVR